MKKGPDIRTSYLSHTFYIDTPYSLTAKTSVMPGIRKGNKITVRYVSFLVGKTKRKFLVTARQAHRKDGTATLFLKPLEPVKPFTIPENYFI